MSDLFDHVAMRALGSEANLRRRPRARFEPTIAPEIMSRFDPASIGEEPSPVEDDPLAAGAMPSAPRPNQAARRLGPEAMDSGRSRPAPKPEARPEPGAAEPVPAEESLRESPIVEPRARVAAETGADTLPRTPPRSDAPSKAPRFVEAVQDPETPSPTAVAPTPTPAPAMLARSPVRVAPSAPAVEHSSSRNRETLGETKGASFAPRAVTPAGPLHRPSAPQITEDAPLPSRPEPGRQDRLGVEARARIERLSPPRVASASEPPPATIEVMIGRLEIRAQSPSAARPAKPFSPHVDLAAYRSRRERPL